MNLSRSQSPPTDANFLSDLKKKLKEIPLRRLISSRGKVSLTFSLSPGSGDTLIVSVGASVEFLMKVCFLLSLRVSNHLRETASGIMSNLLMFSLDNGSPQARQKHLTLL